MPLLVCPKSRYQYWTPHGLRTPDDQQGDSKKGGGHTSATLGKRTSPFPTVWYASLDPLVSNAELLEAWPSLLTQAEAFKLKPGNMQQQQQQQQHVRLCRSLAELPAKGWEGAGGRFGRGIGPDGATSGQD